MKKSFFHRLCGSQCKQQDAQEAKQDEIFEQINVKDIRRREDRAKSIEVRKLARKKLESEREVTWSQFIDYQTVNINQAKFIESEIHGKSEKSTGNWSGCGIATELDVNVVTVRFLIIIFLMVIIFVIIFMIILVRIFVIILILIMIVFMVIVLIVLMMIVLLEI